ncbi:MAG: hypothetical protein WA629_06590 [Candidatus Aquilonibacter sp.]
MDDLAARYDPIIRQIAEIYADDTELAAYIRGLRVNREVWDDGRAGGHFYFEDSPEDAGIEIIDAVADDADRATIAVTLHLVGRCGNWAEWYRWDGEPVMRWPPPSVRGVPGR